MNAPPPTYVYRITHAANIPWILDHGLCAAGSGQVDAGFTVIGNEDLIGKRKTRTVPIAPHGVLDDYVPFYFCTHSVMLYNIHTGVGVPQKAQRDIVYLVSTVERVQGAGLAFVFTDRHAYVANAGYFSNLSDLTRLDWTLIRGRDFKRDTNRPDKMDLRAAEFLVHRQLPVGALAGIACFDDGRTDLVRAEVAQRNLSTPVKTVRSWYF